jgi:hypothetical protein
LWQDINELTQKACLDYTESCEDINQRFNLVPKVHSLSMKA